MISIPEALGASAVLYVVVAAGVFVGVTIADQRGDRPKLYRRGITASLILVIIAALLVQAAIIASAS